jgi:hypothetical protein
MYNEAPHHAIMSNPLLFLLRSKQPPYKHPQKHPNTFKICFPLMWQIKFYIHNRQF